MKQIATLALLLCVVGCDQERQFTEVKQWETMQVASPFQEGLGETLICCPTEDEKAALYLLRGFGDEITAQVLVFGREPSEMDLQFEKPNGWSVTVHTDRSGHLHPIAVKAMVDLLNDPAAESYKLTIDGETTAITTKGFAEQFKEL